jgi:hypothetical protein
MTHYEKRVLAYLWRVCAKHLRKQHRIAFKYAVKFQPGGNTVEKLLPGALPSLKQPAGNYLTTDGGKAIKELVQILSVNFFADNPKCVGCAAIDATGEVHRNASIVDLRCKLPPVRKAVKKKPAAKPLTAVEQRAKLAADKCREWERKGKLAKTKLAKYRKKVTYYKKKGAV